jgi:hypothetical protein
LKKQYPQRKDLEKLNLGSSLIQNASLSTCSYAW